MLNRVVAHYSNGTLVKGTSHDVAPGRPVCHVKTLEGATVAVQLSDLKALFFVRDFDGNPDHVEAEQAIDGDLRLHGTKQIAVEFSDGERIVGLTNRVPPPAPFFFMLPIDNRSNNLRLLVNQASLKASPVAQMA